MMKKPMTTILWGGLIFLGIILLAGSGLTGYLTLYEFRPIPVAKPIMKPGGMPVEPMLREYLLLTWNVGYAGLGKDENFFFDGGSQSKPKEPAFRRYLDGICKTLSAFDTADIIMLQELDTYSGRSYYTDETRVVSSGFPEWFGAFSKNYDCRFVPLPVFQPMGQVLSGIFTMSKYAPVEVTTYYYGTEFPWPQRLAMLKRCFQVLRYKLSQEKDLVIINNHNSTFDKGGELRTKELRHLHGFMMQEFQNGNYVVAGGDWNCNPRGYSAGTFATGDPGFVVNPPVDDSFLPGWQFVFDPALPSNRNVVTAYVKGTTTTTILDFFVVSPNVSVDWIKTISTEFAWSDHQPVMMKIKLTE
jgi:endonuclease/exonuclease/phosphatase family metal-dependent hydrolase